MLESSDEDPPPLDTFRGHAIEFSEELDEYVYADTGKSTVDTWRDRGCGHCGKKDTPEGHDACLGTIDGVMNACCGHGESQCAYVQLWDGRIFRGRRALEVFERGVMKLYRADIEGTEKVFLAAKDEDEAISVLDKADIVQEGDSFDLTEMSEEEAREMRLMEDGVYLMSLWDAFSDSPGSEILGGSMF